MAGVFSPAKKYRLGSGGGKGQAPKSRGRILDFAVVSMFPKASNTSSAYRPAAQTKRAFGGGNQGAISRRAIATMERTSRRVPEVMVRITGRQHGAGHVLANFSYIARLGHGPDKELGLHTSEGDVIHDGKEMQDLAQEWHQYEMEGDSRRRGATSLSMILSMPSGTDPEQVKAAALAFAKDEFANRMWVASLHVDRDHPHVHLTIARRDDNGRRFHPDRDHLLRYRQRFAQKLRDRGIEANATPAKARGIDPKHEHIAARKVREKGHVPRLDKIRAERAERYSAGTRPDPVKPVLSDQHAAVRAAYERSIGELSASPSMVHQMVAKSLRRFVDELPQPEPNSIRAAEERKLDRAAASQAHRGMTAAQAEDLAAAMAQLKKVADEGRAIVERQREQSRTTEPDQSSRSPDAAESGNRAQPLDPIAEILRQVQERDRAQRERERDRDRTPDRGGPKR